MTLRDKICWLLRRVIMIRHCSRRYSSSRGVLEGRRGDLFRSARHHEESRSDDVVTSLGRSSVLRDCHVANAPRNDVLSAVTILWIKPFILTLCCMIANTAIATEKELPIPRFVTIKFDEVNARVGPNKETPIEWVYVKKGEPVEVLAHFDQWRKIKDFYSDGGWVHSTVISGKRSVIVKSKKDAVLLADKTRASRMVAKLKFGLRCELLKIEGDWCKLNCQDYVGYAEKKHLWGVYYDE